MPLDAPQVFPPVRPPLSEQEGEVRERVRQHVEVLAGLIGERNTRVFHAMEAAVAYVRRELGNAGYAVAEQPYDVAGRTCVNLAAELPGRSRPDLVIIAGAHYDSVLYCPGANDNATGVAAVLEAARLLSGRRLARTVRFVAFANEEPPWFKTQAMGSHVYAARCRERREKVVAMYTPETIGFYSEAEGSQEYPSGVPRLLKWGWPTRGDFLLFAGNLRSALVVRRCVRSFRRHATGFPARGLAAPSWVPCIDLSDHASFWNEGYPGVMVTDTAPFRYRHYHTAQDTPDKIDYDRTARVVAGLAEMTADLAGREG